MSTTPTTTMHVVVADLAQPIQAALEAVGYRRKDIRVSASTSVVLGGSAADGYRAFTALVDLAAGRHEVMWGSWGGPNMFNRTNAVDNDHRPYALPANGVAITGRKGGTQPVSAQVHVHPQLLARMLPAGPEQALGKLEMDALACFVGFTSAYRKERMARLGITNAVLDGLVAKGLLKRTKSGATSVTTAGKNAVGDHRVY